MASPTVLDPDSTRMDPAHRHAPGMHGHSEAGPFPVLPPGAPGAVSYGRAAPLGAQEEAPPGPWVQPAEVPAPLDRTLVERVRQRLAGSGVIPEGPVQLRAAVAAALRDEGTTVPAHRFAVAVQAIADELTGLGPLAPLVSDTAVTDVCVNGPDEVWVERHGRLERVAVRFGSPAALHAMIQRVIAPLGLRVDESRPWVDARLPGGERFHAVLPPLAPDGPLVTIRTFARHRLGLADLVSRETFDHGTAALLRAMVAAGVTTLVAGATGSGKTTLLNVLAGAISEDERVLTIEDAAELRLGGPHVVRLESRPPNVEGRGEVPLRELVRNALRMRPDRIVVGEVRGGEAFDLLQAANTGHRGLLATLHAGSPDEVPGRLEAMALSAPGAVPGVVRRLVGAVDAVVQLERTPAGRRVTAVAELRATADGEMRAVPLRLAAGQGGLVATGVVPQWAVKLPPTALPLFEPPHPVSGEVVVLPVGRWTG